MASRHAASCCANVKAMKMNLLITGTDEVSLDLSSGSTFKNCPAELRQLALLAVTSLVLSSGQASSSTDG
jgi:hypothetical protein